MATQFIVRSHNLKHPFSIKTVIHSGVEVKRGKENDIPVFELSDPDLVIELVVKRKNSASSAGASSDRRPALKEASSPSTSATVARLRAQPAAAAKAAAKSRKNKPANKSRAPHKSSEWNKHFAELVAFKQKHGHINVSYKENPALATWVAQHATPLNQRQCNEQTAEEENNWNSGYMELVQYKKRYGNCLVKTCNNHQYPKLGPWVVAQRVAFNKGLLVQGRVDKLNELGFSWDAKESKWHLRYALLIKYKQQHGHVKVPQFYTVPQKEGPPIPLGQWVHTIRAEFKEGKVSADRISKLNELGFVWGIRNKVDWNERYRELIEYREINGDCNVPQGYKLNKALGPWVDKQRQKYRKGLMPRDQEEKLNAVGFEWVRGKSPNRDYSKFPITKKRKRAEYDDESDKESINEPLEEENGANDRLDDLIQQQPYHNPNEQAYPNVNFQHPYFHDEQHQYQRFWP